MTFALLRGLPSRGRPTDVSWLPPLPRESMRIFLGTLRFLAVTAACGLPVTAGLVSAGDVAADPGADLRLAMRPGTPPAERLAAIDRVLESAPVLSASEAARAVQAAMGLLSDGSDRAARLLLRALDSGELPEDLLEHARLVVRQALAQPPPPTGDDGVAACALVLGLRGPAARLFARPASDAVRRIVAQDAPELVGPDGVLAPELWAQPSGGPAWTRHVELAALLDAACADDPRVSQPALSALVARGGEAFPLLLATATPPTPLVDPTVRVYRAAAARTAIPGRLPRRVRAIVALGALRDRRATPVLIACLSDQDDGWARVAAANALGDIGDPAAAVALCNLLSYAGDRHRVRDGWDYPGSSETDVPQADWNDVEYYAVDANAADALLPPRPARRGRVADREPAAGDHRAMADPGPPGRRRRDPPRLPRRAARTTSRTRASRAGTRPGASSPAGGGAGPSLRSGSTRAIPASVRPYASSSAGSAGATSCAPRSRRTRSGCSGPRRRPRCSRKSRPTPAPPDAPSSRRRSAACATVARPRRCWDSPPTRSPPCARPPPRPSARMRGRALSSTGRRRSRATRSSRASSPCSATAPPRCGSAPCGGCSTPRGLRRSSRPSRPTPRPCIPRTRCPSTRCRRPWSSCCRGRTAPRRSCG